MKLYQEYIKIRIYFYINLYLNANLFLLISYVQLRQIELNIYGIFNNPRSLTLYSHLIKEAIAINFRRETYKIKLKIFSLKWENDNSFIKVTKKEDQSLNKLILFY